MRHTESLKLVVDGKTVVDWSEGYKFLKPDLRRPLAEIEDTIREAFEEFRFPSKRWIILITCQSNR